MDAQVKDLDSLWVELEGRSETFADSPQRTETGERFQLTIAPLRMMRMSFL